MKNNIVLAIAFSLSLAPAGAQNSNSGTPASTNSGGATETGSYAQRGRFSGSVGRIMAGGGGVVGAVTEVAADHLTVKVDTGEVYTVYFGVNSRILKMPAGAQGGDMGRGPGQGPGGGRPMGGAAGPGGRMGQGGNPPVPIKATDIKVGDAVAAMGEVNAQAKSLGAITIIQLDPERARQMKEMQANFGKTWLLGKVTAVEGVKVTLMSSIDNAPHAFLADENTSFRKRRVPITLADIQVGDTVRAEGTLKDGAFTATAVSVSGAPQGETPTVPGAAAPQ